MSAVQGNNIVFGDNGLIDYVRAEREALADGADLNPGDIDLILSTATTSTLPTGFGGVDNITSGDGQDIIIAGRYGDTVNANNGDNLVIGDSGQVEATESNTVNQFVGHPITIGLIETIQPDDGGSDGEYYLKASTLTWEQGSLSIPFFPVKLPPLIPLTDDPPSGLTPIGIHTNHAIFPEQWVWSFKVSQSISVPDNVEQLSVDILGDPQQMQIGVSLTYTISETSIITAFLNPGSLSPTPAPNGFSRYIIDVGDFAGLDKVHLSIGAGIISHDGIPDTIETFGIDNISFTTIPFEVGLDIKPGNDQNPVNLGSKGVLKVAVLGSDTLDVNDIDKSTLSLEGASPLAKGNGKGNNVYKDVNHDGVDDLVLWFDIEDIDVDGEIEELSLLGELLSGESFIGGDSILAVPSGVSLDDYAVLDGYNDVEDLIIWEGDEFTLYDLGGLAASAVPEPASLSLLGLGGLALLRRRK